MKKYDLLNRKLNQLISEIINQKEKELDERLEQMKNTLLDKMETALNQKDINKALDWKLKLDLIKILGL